MASFQAHIQNLFKKFRLQRQQPRKTASKQQNSMPQDRQKHQYATLDGGEQKPLQTQSKATATSNGTLQIALQNQTTSSTVYAYISTSSGVVWVFVAISSQLLKPG